MYAYGQELIAAKRAEPDRRHAVRRGQRHLDDADAPCAVRNRAVPVLQPAVQRRRGDDPQRHRRWAAGAGRAPRPDARCCVAISTLLPTAVEEMVRWTSPSPSKRRTATRDVELAGCAIAAGQKVQVWEGSANRDAAVFEDARRFDITRKPNPHLGFGQGVHYCLGANLARLELRVLFEELLARFSSVQVVKPVEWTRSNRHTGIRHLVVELTVMSAPDVFAAVMATGIVSIAAADHGYAWISARVGGDGGVSRCRCSLWRRGDRGDGRRWTSLIPTCCFGFAPSWRRAGCWGAAGRDNRAVGAGRSGTAAWLLAP